MPESTIPVTTEQQPVQAPATRETSRYLVPPVDIYEKGDGLVVVADLPGAAKDKVDVRVENGILTIRAWPEYESRGAPVAEEFKLYEYFRQFELSNEVDQDKIDAEFNNGVLTLRLPKSEKAKPRQIAVTVS
jgi:HSP20 family protein